jgi:hypothetical protein
MRAHAAGGHGRLSGSIAGMALACYRRSAASLTVKIDNPKTAQGTAGCRPLVGKRYAHRRFPFTQSRRPRSPTRSALLSTY